MKKAYYMKFSSYSVYENMAIDEFLYMYVDEPVMRFYNFTSDSLTIGYNQKYSRSCNTEFIEENNMNITRRITGGRTVLHCGDLTYSFSSAYKYFSQIINGKNNLLERYKKLSDAFVNGFHKANIDIEVNKGESKTPYGANCFSSTSIFEITLKGEKILGSAQTFNEKRFLQQGTILVNDCSKYHGKVFDSNVKLKNIENISGVVYNIKRLSEHFYNAFFESVDFEWEEFNFDFENENYIALLNKYKNSDWIKRR